MEHGRRTKIIAISSVLCAILVLTISYAVFTRNLKITSETTSIQGQGTGLVKISYSSEVSESPVEPTYDAAQVFSPGIVDNSGPNPKITNIVGKINDSSIVGETYYNFYILNDSNYDAFLKKIEIANATGYNTPVACVAGEGATQESVDNACKGIAVRITIFGKKGTYILEATKDGVKHGIVDQDLEEGNYTSGLEDKLLKKGTKTSLDYVTAKLTIYSKYNGVNSAEVDGPYEAYIGDITIKYSSSLPY